MEIDLARFAQICGMLGSDHEGERAAAAAFATRMLRSAGLTWSELLGLLVERDEAHRGGARTVKTKTYGGHVALDLIRACVAATAEIGLESDWDEVFLESVSRQAGRFGRNTLLSARQWVHLVRIAEALGVIQDSEAAQ